MTHRNQQQEIILQIHSGSFTGKAATFEDIRQKVEPILSRIKVPKVLMGMSADRKLNEAVRDYLYQNKIEFYLWLPVFAELDEVKKGYPLIDFHGKDKGDYQLSEREDFTFYCPNHPQNVFNVLRVFEENFSSIGYTGIFLDKIRYSSFANGLNAVLTCFCPFCQIKYREANFDPQDLETSIKILLQKHTPFGAVSYQKGRYIFDDDRWNKFFYLKNQIITDAVRGICQYFQERNYKIGLDVFAPFGSHFVGQDVPALSTFADFVKPMMYRMTNAPAGLPFELDAILQESTSNDEQKKAFYKVLGFDPEKQPFDLDFTVKDLKELVQTSKAPVYPGVEINRVRRIAEVNPLYIEETINAYSQTDVKGFVLSWNLLNAPQENIEQIIKMFS